MRRECALGAIVARAEVRFGIDGIAGWVVAVAVGWMDGWVVGYW